MNKMINVKFTAIEWAYTTQQTGEFTSDTWGNALAIPVTREVPHLRIVGERSVLEHDPVKSAPLGIEEEDEPTMYTYTATSRITGQTMRVRAESFSAAVKRVNKTVNWFQMNVTREGV